MSTPIVMAEKRRPAPVRPDPAAPDAAWRSLTAFGCALAVIGFGQVAINFYPAGFGSAEWQFGVTAQALSSLPLPSMGLAAILAGVVATSSRRGLLSTAIVLVLAALLTGLALAAFWAVVPVALSASAGSPAAAAVRQTVARATLTGAGFGFIYLFGAVLAFRRLRQP